MANLQIRDKPQRQINHGPAIRVARAVKDMTPVDTKNGEPRGVPLNKAAIAALSALEPDRRKREGKVFKRKDGEDWGQIRTGWEMAVKRAGLNDFRFHDLRHTAASHLAMRGRPLKEIQEVLGHKSFSTTLRYAHLSPMHLRTAVESLEGLTPTPEIRNDLPEKAHAPR
jgi:integrase